MKLDFRDSETLECCITRKEHSDLIRLVYSQPDNSWPPVGETRERILGFIEKAFERYRHPKCPPYDRRGHLYGLQVVELKVVAIAQLKYQIEV